MYVDIEFKIEKIRGQIERVSYKMIEAEGEDYDKLSDKLERLENRLEELTLVANDMELLVNYDE